MGVVVREEKKCEKKGMVGCTVACDIKKRIICVTSYCFVLISSVEDITSGFNTDTACFHYS